MKQQNHFRAAFRAVRLARALTQEDFAQQSGRTYISKLERKVKQPTLQKVHELSEPLGVHPLTILVLAYVSKFETSSCEKLLKEVRTELLEIIIPASGER